MAKLVLDPNVAVALDVKYCDLVDSQYGLQLRFKGATASDRDAVLYADVAHAETELVRAGALAAPLDIPNEVPPRGMAVALKLRRLVFTKVQAAGERTSRLAIMANGRGATQSPAVPADRTARDAARGGRGTPQAATSSALPPGEARRRSLVGLFGECLDVTLQHLEPRFRRHGRELSDAGVAVIAAALFTQRCQEDR